MSPDLARELEAVAILRASLADCEDDALVVDMIEGETSFLEAVDKVLDAIVEAGALEEGARAAAAPARRLRP